jgi:periplasmic divalent cation tolerance protein
VVETIVEHHPYETPEVVAVPIVAGYAGYLDWIDDVTGGVSGATGNPPT